MNRLQFSSYNYDARLTEIANVLGIPVSKLYDEASHPYVDSVTDLIRLYASITDAQGRQRVLNIARREMERCQARHCPDP